MSTKMFRVRLNTTKMLKASEWTEEDKAIFEKVEENLIDDEEIRDVDFATLAKMLLDTDFSKDCLSITILGTWDSDPEVEIQDLKDRLSSAWDAITDAQTSLSRLSEHIDDIDYCIDEIEGYLNEAEDDTDC